MATDFQAIVDGMAAMTCVISVKESADEHDREFRIVTGNQSYIDSIENPVQGTQMLKQEFVPNSVYTDYLTRDLNFENYCYRSAVEKRCLHSYAHPERMNLWFNMTFLPVEADDDGLSYCTYTMEINFQPNYERLSNVSSVFASKVLGMAIALRGTDDFRDAMATVTKDVRVMCESEYCGILQVDEEAETCALLGESIADNSTLVPIAQFFDSSFYEIAKTWSATIAGSNCIIAKDEYDMEVVRQRNPVWHATLVEGNIKSIALFPLESHGTLLGYIWVVNFAADRSTSIKEALELATHVLAVEIDNHLMVGRLKELSSKDMLTGTFNRNEMDNRLNALVSGIEGAGQSVAVVFVDLNGLKAVNDSAGHAAGDKLLKDGAAALLEVFSPRDVYRAGGDEFVIIETGVTDQQLENQIAALKQAEQERYRLSFAIGHHIAPNAKDVRQALREADAHMYENKAAHYARSKKQGAHSA